MKLQKTISQSLNVSWSAFESVFQKLKQYSTTVNKKIPKPENNGRPPELIRQARGVSWPVKLLVAHTTNPPGKNPALLKENPHKFSLKFSTSQVDVEGFLLSGDQNLM